MCDSLRTIFETAKSPTTLRRGVTALTIASLFAICVQSSTPNNDNFYEILDLLPKEAIAYNPSHSNQNKDSHYKIDFQTALTEFKNTCAGMPSQIDTQPEAQEWVYHNLPRVNLPDTSLNFRDSMYNLTVTFDASEPKDVLLTSLNRSLPNSRILMDYLEYKRIELAKTLQQDSDIQRAAQNWNTINDDAYKQRILQRVSRITLQTLLPNKDIDYPRVIWDKERLPFNLYGTIRPAENNIYINARIRPSNYNFQFASDITVHETIHHFQYVLIKWGMDGHFKSIPDLDRYISIMSTGFNNRTGAVRTDVQRPETFVRYRLLKPESMSWGFSLVGNTIANPQLTDRLENSLERDMYTFFEIQEPLNNKHHSDMLNGAPIPTMLNDPRTGKLPRACMVN